MRPVLFDMDGVLITSQPAVHTTWDEWAERRGIDPRSLDGYLHGRRTVEVVAHFAPDLDPMTEAIAVEAAIVARATPASAVRPVCDLYSSLDPAKRAVATSALRRTAESNFPILGIEQPQALVTSEDVERGKPAPDAYLLAAARLGADPADCVVIEDATAGITAGKAAGARVVAVTTTHTVAELAETDADAIVAPEELLDVERCVALLG